ncbi:hypothetical protein [Piscinibacter gummiphilus]|uniref:Uncharacterized protein n=1 Tax=Piscinibacter gummiphilus TaxID=946333 RepID=A0ABZ0CN96_9BURK|nr:hypothetical protein [Piscinibacter gummiphilus]WOB06460.1 hypothetical protein RXV79_16180 [Piscinibacter gummiphilus]
MPPHLLPDTAAQEAIDCNFTHGHLMPMKQGFLLTTLSAAVKTIYTQDGLNFFTWPTETYVFDSPVLEDVHNRVYYLDGGVLRVTTADGMSPAGGPPGTSWKVGVPNPTVAPTLSVVELDQYPDYPGAEISIDAWYEADGLRYQEASMTLTVVNPLRRITYSMPARGVGVPATAEARASVLVLDTDDKQVMLINLTAGEDPVQSTSLPGGVTLTLTNTSGNAYQLDLAYGVVENRAYVYTNENTWNEESGPSPAAQINTTYVQAVDVALTASDFTGLRPFLRFNTYRTMGASPTYVKVRADADGTYIDTSYKASQVLGALETLEYEPPPAELTAAVSMPGGSFAAFNGNALYISEPYRPHSWQYRTAFPKAIRGLCLSSQSLIVATAEYGYAVVGSHPSAIQAIKLPVPQAGIAQRSMVELDGVGAYASHDGIVAVVGSRATLRASQKLFARDDWQGRYASILADASMRFAWHDGCLVATSSTRPLGFILRMDEMAAGEYTQFNHQIDATFQLPVADSLYYSVGNSIYQFAGGASYTYTWRSKDFTFSRQYHMGAGYIRSSNAVTMTLYYSNPVDENEMVEWVTMSVSPGYFRLPDGPSARRWSVKLVGTSVVEELLLGQSMGQLKNV